LAGGSGGFSTVYTKPAWQIGTGVPNDGVRDLPDISLYSSVDSASNSFYPVCDYDALGEPCSQNAFLGAGGTSFAAPIFAGIMALVVQETGERQGNPNYVLYPLAAKSGASCTSDATAVSKTGCIFYDTVTGNNSVACAASTPNCSNQTSSGYGVLVVNTNATPMVPAWTTTAGYDLATGLGSVNVANLVNNWNSVAGNFTPTTTALTLSTTPPTTPVTVTHGQPVNVSVIVTPVPTPPPGTPTGDVSLIAATSTSGAAVPLTPMTLSNGSLSTTTNFLPGGTYNVTAHYAGDGTFAASDSTPQQVTVTQESSQTTVRLITFDFITGIETNANATNITYGTPSLIRMDVTNSSGNACASQQAALQYPCPTGIVSLSEPTGSFQNVLSKPGICFNTPCKLNSLGYAEDQVSVLGVGTDTISASYNGDASYSSSTSAQDAITVTQAPTTVALQVPSSVGAGDPLAITASLIALAYGAAPTGTVQFLNGSSSLGSASCVGVVVPPPLPAMCAALFTTSLTSSATITAQYSGDSNYLASTSMLYPITVTPDFSIAANPTSASIASPGLSATSTVTVTPAGGFTGSVSFTCLIPYGMWGATCSLSPPAVTTSGPTTLTVTTQAPSGGTVTPRNYGGPWWIVFALSFAACLLLLSRIVKASRLRLAFSLCVLALFSIAFVSCGGGGGGGGGGSSYNPGTPAGTYNVGVTATSGTLSHSLSVTVTVQ